MHSLPARWTSARAAGLVGLIVCSWPGQSLRGQTTSRSARLAKPNVATTVRPSASRARDTISVWTASQNSMDLRVIQAAADAFNRRHPATQVEIIFSTHHLTALDARLGRFADQLCRFAKSFQSMAVLGFVEQHRRAPQPS